MITRGPALGRALATVLAVSLSAGACTRDGDQATTSTATATAPRAATAPPVSGTEPVAAPRAATSPPPTTPVPGATITTAPPAPPTTVAPPDPTTLLMGALDALIAGYHFVTTATVAGQVAVSAEGDHVAGSTQMTVTSGGTSTEYLVTAGAAWAQADGEWQQLDSAEGLSDPVAQLRSPVEIELSGDAEAATIVAHYPAAALGVPGDGQHPVEFQLAGGQIVSLRYPTTTSAGEPAEVVAVISPVAPGTEITLPNSAN